MARIEERSVGRMSSGPTRKHVLLLQVDIFRLQKHEGGSGVGVLLISALLGHRFEFK